ncbi:hypothetical protein GCM10008014_04450 [Paenibacillus silvae]|uniref:Uncharacterized protein n=1 Tax=Paenibacillus silvae TaxID=1325358 RepID=A0ABQ1YZK0_9BACL|nr:hypothetical protein [Paenibacillus silvae]GGH43593.1 hypothetical protein GCM10008014_04450 [Paenibacillus silvae]
MKKALLIGMFLIAAGLGWIWYSMNDLTPIESTTHIVSVELQGDSSCKVTVSDLSKGHNRTKTETFESPSCSKLKGGDEITYRYLNEGKYLYIVSINKELTKDPLTGVIAKMIEHDGLLLYSRYISCFWQRNLSD